MPAFARVEDIDVWRESRVLASTVYRQTSQGPWSRDWGLRDQIRRAVVSIPCNIAEGYARETHAEFNRFLAIGRGSANEAKTQMYIAPDLEYVDQETFDGFYKHIDRICRMLTGLMDYLKSPAAKLRQPSTANRQPPTTGSK